MSEPSAAELRTAVQGVLGSKVLGPAFQTRSDLYEVYLWALVVRAAISEGASVRFCTPVGVAAPPFTFRSGPGPIARDRSPFVHAELDFNGRPVLEAHQGIYISGSSLNRHECDVVVIESTECDLARGSGVDPRSSKCKLAIEARLYGGRIGIGLARGFAGLKQDLWLSKSSAFFVSNSSMELVARYLNRHAFRWQESVAPALDRHGDFFSEVKRRFQVFKTS